MKKLFKSLILTILFIFLSVSIASASTTITRYAGYDRYATAVSIAISGWTQSDTCILVSGENYPDALCATPLAKKYNAPILLTTSNSLPDITKQELINLKVKNVTIVGGTGVISPSIETELQSMNINVTRLAGLDRYETSIKVAQQVYNTTELFVVTADDYSDGLSVSPIAAMKQVPIILVSSDYISDSVKSYISTLNISKTYIIGYSDIISDSVASQFPNYERILGADKYARNIAINQKFNSEFNTSGVCIASGEGFPDALSGSALASKLSEPIILVNNATPDNTKNYYQQRLALSNSSKVYVYGGNGVVSDSVVSGLSSVAVNPIPVPSPVPNPQPTPIPTPTQMSDADFQNYLNQNYGVLTIDGESVHFIFGMGGDLFSFLTDKTIYGHIDENDYVTWLKWIIGRRQNDIKPFFNRINQVIASNYPGKSFFADVTYQAHYSFYPDSYKPDEISYSNGKWLVTHSIVTFSDLKVMGISNPVVEIQ